MFRSSWYDFLQGEALHPIQFSEVTARIMYDQTVLHDDAKCVTYYWNKPVNSVIAQIHSARSFNPYLADHHDPARLAEYIGRHTFNDPAQILRPEGAVFTCLQDTSGKFLHYAVTDAELEAARADPNQIIVGPMDAEWRTRK